ncbi:MAG: ribosomal protein S18-alanine N-acetyltransferase [Rhodanobacteraceae bacterium]
MAAMPRDAIFKEPFANLRPMRDYDLDEVAAIEFGAYEFPWTRGIFRDCMRAGHECWVLARAREIVGYGVLSVAAGEAHLLNACIASSSRRQGLGRRLVQRLLDLARWNGAERVFLEVRPSNHAAIALYQSLEFNEIGRRPNYYPDGRGREDALLMAIELLPDNEK